MCPNHCRLVAHDARFRGRTVDPVSKVAVACAAAGAIDACLMPILIRP
jgi:hypothetical protein